MKLFILIFILCTSSFSAQKLLTPESPAPSFVLQTTSGTREYLRVWNGWKLMKPYKNKIRHRVILSFWSTTCMPCMKEIPELHRFAENHPNDSLKIFLVNLDKLSPAEIKKFADDKQWTLPILLDPYQNTSKRYAVTSIPTIYVISPIGEIEHAFTGIPEEFTADEYLESLIYASKEECEHMDSIVANIEPPVGSTTTLE